ncbi:MAG: indole-3-glycerol phosphate synthase TrpC [Muribaculaceae bacterium]|nr:indole-3-glycerol phosphate synthase TrpC [Muribaculaceae bacterium]
MNILEEIAATKRREVEAMKLIVPEKTMKVEAYTVLRSIISMKSSILNKKPGIIAEHKRRSPSKGEIHPMSDVAKVAAGYVANGASAMSVLTDTPYFGGSVSDFMVARQTAPRLPLLRKEFIVDEYQIFQSRLIGADAVLLISSILDADTLRRFNDTAHMLGLETLVEVHSLHELSSLPEDADMVGVNNRDLTSFSTDISNSRLLFDSLPAGMVKIAESGILKAEDIVGLQKIGFDGFLIGEAFMSAPDPGERLAEFIDYANSNKN